MRRRRRTIYIRYDRHATNSNNMRLIPLHWLVFTRDDSDITDVALLACRLITLSSSPPLSCLVKKRRARRLGGEDWSRRSTSARLKFNDLRAREEGGGGRDEPHYISELCLVDLLVAVPVSFCEHRRSLRIARLR
eukprot:255586-Hanusia_phi.AAC.2